jgi:hypothetical protein
VQVCSGNDVVSRAWRAAQNITDAEEPEKTGAEDCEEHEVIWQVKVEPVTKGQ